MKNQEVIEQVMDPTGVTESGLPHLVAGNDREAYEATFLEVYKWPPFEPDPWIVTNKERTINILKIEDIQLALTKTRRTDDSRLIIKAIITFKASSLGWSTRNPRNPGNPNDVVRFRVLFVANNESFDIKIGLPCPTESVSDPWAIEHIFETDIYNDAIKGRAKISPLGDTVYKC